MPLISPPFCDLEVYVELFCFTEKKLFAELFESFLSFFT